MSFCIHSRLFEGAIVSGSAALLCRHTLRMFRDPVYRQQHNAAIKIQSFARKVLARKFVRRLGKLLVQLLRLAFNQTASPCANPTLVSDVQYNKAIDPMSGMYYYINRVTLQVWLLCRYHGVFPSEGVVSVCACADDLVTAQLAEGRGRHQNVPTRDCYALETRRRCPDDPTRVATVCSRRSVVALLP